MAINATSVIEGTVMKVDVRNVTSKTSGDKFVFTNMLVIGENTLCEVRVPDSLKPEPVGTAIVGRVRVSSYRNEAQFDLEEYLS